MDKQPIQEERSYWDILEENLPALEEITNSIAGYAHTSEGEDIQHINDRILELVILAKEMKEELIDG